MCACTGHQQHSCSIQTEAAAPLSWIPGQERLHLHGFVYHMQPFLDCTGGRCIITLMMSAGTDQQLTLSLQASTILWPTRLPTTKDVRNIPSEPVPLYCSWAWSTFQPGSVVAAEHMLTGID